MTVLLDVTVKGGVVTMSSEVYVAMNSEIESKQLVIDALSLRAAQLAQQLEEKENIWKRTLEELAK